MSSYQGLQGLFVCLFPGGQHTLDPSSMRHAEMAGFLDDGLNTQGLRSWFR